MTLATMAMHASTMHAFLNRPEGIACMMQQHVTIVSNQGMVHACMLLGCCGLHGDPEVL